MINFSIAPANLGDAEIVTNLARSLFIELGYGTSIPDEKAMFDKCQYLLEQDDKYHAFIARGETGHPVGLITLHENDALFCASAFAEVMEFFIAPDYRSKGLGKRMLDEVIEFSKEMKWNHLALNAPQEDLSPATIRFYEREGFSHKGPYMGRKIASL